MELVCICALHHFYFHFKNRNGKKIFIGIKNWIQHEVWVYQYSWHARLLYPWDIALKSRSNCFERAFLQSIDSWERNRMFFFPLNFKDPCNRYLPLYSWALNSFSRRCVLLCICNAFTQNFISSLLRRASDCTCQLNGSALPHEEITCLSLSNIAPPHPPPPHPLPVSACLHKTIKYYILLLKHISVYRRKDKADLRLPNVTWGLGGSINCRESLYVSCC